MKQIQQKIRRYLKVSIRTRLILAFLLIIGFSIIINGWVIFILYKLEYKNHFLEITESYMNEIQQARRFEKNYLLYGTNLKDAAEHIHLAKVLLEDNRAEIIKILKVENVNVLLQHARDYEKILLNIGRTGDHPIKKRIEKALRFHGSELVTIAMNFVEKEKEEVSKNYKLARKITFIFLIILAVMLFAISAFIMRGVFNTLSRLLNYTEKIAKGDFTRIDTTKDSKDEFFPLEVAISKMIDELEKRQKILVESHKIRAIGNLVAGVAHELNNPLNNIMLTSSSLQEDYDDLDEKDKIEMVDDIIGETERSQEIVRNLLDFARESETTVVSVSLEKVLKKSITLVANQVKLAKIHLTTDIPLDLPPIHSDPQLLKQVFVNILLNAVDALPEKGEIFISADNNMEDGFICINIKDNGPGIPEHVLQRIFEPFFTTKLHDKGTGLGLSVSRGIIGKLGGRILVKSKVTKGTTFTLMLPKTDIPFV